MPVDFDLREDPLDNPVLADDEGCPFDPHHLPAVHVLLFVDAVCRGYPSFGVGEQRHIQTVLVSEAGLFRDVVRTDAYDDGPSFFYFGFCITEPGCFPRSTRRVSLRIEEQYHSLLAGVIAEVYLVAMVVLQRKGGRFTAFLQHISSE